MREKLVKFSKMIHLSDYWGIYLVYIVSIVVISIFAIIGLS